MRRLRVAPLRAVDDPRDAVAILMLLIARDNGVRRASRSAIEDKLRSVFGFERELPERKAQARFIARQTKVSTGRRRVRTTVPAAADPDEAVNSSTCWRTSRTRAPSESQIEAITAFKPMIGLAPARWDGVVEALSDSCGSCRVRQACLRRGACSHP